MNGLLWIAQLILAGVFLLVGVTKIVSYEKLVKELEARSKSGPIGMTRGQAAVVGLLEIVGALGVVVPLDLGGPYFLVLLAAGGLALLMVAAGIYHLLREESAAPSVALFLLALFIIVGRWPR
ncbi:MAG: DoxX family protein [Terracidiphilus sp.]